MQLSDAGALFIANFEGFRADPYWDVDHHSIGYGTPARSLQDHVTRDEALRRLHDHVEEHVGPAVSKLKPFGQPQYDALASFAYNLGAGVIEPHDQVGAAVLRHDYRLAGDAMLNYTRADGVVLPGLVRRRESERRLLLRVRYLEDEVTYLARLKRPGNQPGAVRWLKARAHEIQAHARAEDDWQKNDRGRRYQGIRRALRRYA